MNDINHMYLPDSFAGPFNENEFREFQGWLLRCGFSKIHFDENYIAYLRKFHGGRMDNGLIKTKSGDQQVIGRFLNFADDSNRFSEYNIEATWSSISDRMGDHLMPFAELLGGDLLCFDHNTKPPSVVVWYHELSKPEEEPVYEFVAKDFKEFLGKITDN